jgi:hypothetical protein
MSSKSPRRAKYRKDMITRWRVLGFIGGGGYGIPRKPPFGSKRVSVVRMVRPIRVFGTHRTVMSATV